MKAENKWYYIFRGERKATYILLFLIAVAVAARIWYIYSDRECDTPTEAECVASIEMLKQYETENSEKAASLKAQKRATKKSKNKSNKHNNTPNTTEYMNIVPKQ